MIAKPTTPKVGAKRVETPNAKLIIEVRRADLPLHCPTPETSLWNSHPQVYLPIEDSGKATCPYCGTQYILKD